MWNRGTGLVYQFCLSKTGTLTPSLCSTRIIKKIGVQKDATREKSTLIHLWSTTVKLDFYNFIIS